jgi:flagellar hook-length control protein FliK
MALIEDVARSMDRDQGSRELLIRLEPEHLGPLAVKLTVDQRGIRARIATRTDGAAAALASGQEGLRQRLLGLGYASARVEVEQDDQAFEEIRAI